VQLSKDKLFEILKKIDPETVRVPRVFIQFAAGIEEALEEQNKEKNEMITLERVLEAIEQSIEDVTIAVPVEKGNYTEPTDSPISESRIQIINPYKFINELKNSAA
jgi:rRNA pseudouridine-1189 N-methylase Emg1 (Nep1/Mra1 family)